MTTQKSFMISTVLVRHRYYATELTFTFLPAFLSNDIEFMHKEAMIKLDVCLYVLRH